MKNQALITKALLWTARIADALILSFLLFFVFAHVFEINEASAGFNNSKEIIMFLFFPSGVILGLIAAWKWEMTGGLIVLFGMAAFFMMQGRLILNPYFIAPVLTAMLFIAHSMLKNGDKFFEGKEM